MHSWLRSTLAFLMLAALASPLGAADVQVIDMAQGAKKSRVLAWRFTSRP